MSHEQTIQQYAAEHYHELYSGVSDRFGYLRPDPPAIDAGEGLCLYLWRRIRYCSAIDPRPRGLGSEDLVQWAESLGLPRPVGPDAATAQPYLYVLEDVAHELATTLHLDPTACARYWARQIARQGKESVSGADQPFRLTDADPLEGLDEFLEGL